MSGYDPKRKKTSPQGKRAGRQLRLSRSAVNRWEPDATEVGAEAVPSRCGAAATLPAPSPAGCAVLIVAQLATASADRIEVDRSPYRPVGRPTPAGRFLQIPHHVLGHGFGVALHAVVGSTHRETPMNRLAGLALRPRSIRSSP